MIIPTPEISDANEYGVPAPGATIYHPPVTVGGVTYSGWDEFQGAALEYYSQALLDLICSLWADMLDPEADGSPTSLQTWIAGVTAGIDLHVYDESDWKIGALEELALLEMVLGVLRTSLTTGEAAA